MNEQTNYKQYLNKHCRIILTVSKEQTISYTGKITSIDSESIILQDKKITEPILITKKDISQIIPTEE